MQPRDPQAYDPWFGSDGDPGQQPYDPMVGSGDDPSPMPLDHEMSDPWLETGGDPGTLPGEAGNGIGQQLSYGQQYRSPEREVGGRPGLAARYPQLHPTLDRLQNLDGSPYTWHVSRPEFFVAPGGEFVTDTGVPTGEYFLRANLFTRTELTFGDYFYLVRDQDGQYSADDFSDEPGPDAVGVAWHHIMQHTYTHHTDFKVKEVHTMWPPDTTEEEVLAALVADLNAGSNRVIWEDESQSAVKTYFLTSASSPADRYSAAQLDDLFSVL